MPICTRVCVNAFTCARGSLFFVCANLEREEGLAAARGGVKGRGVRGQGARRKLLEAEDELGGLGQRHLFGVRKQGKRRRKTKSKKEEKQKEK